MGGARLQLIATTCMTTRDLMSHPQDREVARLQLHESFSWCAALWASVVAALVFAMLDIGLGWALRGISPWVPLRMMGAIVLGPAALSPPDTFDAQIVVVAILLHLVLSIAYGIFLGLVIPRVDTALGILVGGFYGLALYYINFYGFNAFSPWFVDQRDWVSIASHCAFGAVLAYAYTAINRRGSSRPAGGSTPSLDQGRSCMAGSDSNSYDTAPRPTQQRRGTSTVSEADSRRALPQGAPSPIHRQSSMPSAFCPRLSEAKHLLRLVRSHLIAAASRYPLPTGMGLDLLPIVQDGLFGYELVPDRKSHTYLTIGCDAQGKPVVRKTLYGVGAPNAVQLVAVNGHRLSRTERAARYSIQQRDSHFPDWSAAAESAWAQLVILFPERPRQPIILRENVHQCLDEALSIAHSHLAHWNPFIHFCGLPDEAQQGIALTGANGERGELIFQRPDIWMLRWKAPPEAVYESWSVMVDDTDAAGDMSQNNLAS
jgi:hypothetical protein